MLLVFVYLIILFHLIVASFSSICVSHPLPLPLTSCLGCFPPPIGLPLLRISLCSFGARRKSRFLVLGAEKRRFFGAPEKKSRKKFLGAEKKIGGFEKVIWPPNTITRWRRKKQTKKTRFFRLGAEKYDFRALKERRPTVFRSAEKKKPSKKIWGSKKNFGRSKKLFGRRTP